MGGSTSGSLEKTKPSLRKMRRTLRTWSECARALTRADDERELLSEVCRIAVETGGYRLAWVGLAEHDRRKTVRPVAQAGYEAGYLDTLDITWADKPRGRGPTGTAIRTGQPAVARDIHTDPRLVPWRAEAEKRDYASSAALPLVLDGETVGALNVYSQEPDAFDADELGLLSDLASDLAFGLGSLRTERERRRAEEVQAARLRLHRFAMTRSLDELLQETLDEACALTGSTVGFCHFLESDQRTLVLRAWSTRTLEQCTAEAKGSRYDLHDAGVWADCVRERRTVIHNDYGTLAHRKGLPPGHAPVVRELTVPVFRGDRIVAILGAGNKADEYGDSDVDTVTRLADLAWDIADLKMAENDLADSDARFRGFFDLSADMVCIAEIDGRFRELNDPWSKVLGYTSEELTGRPFMDFVHPDDKEATARVIEEQLKQGKTVLHFENRYLRKDGGVVWLEWTSQPMVAEGVTFAIARDITDRKRADEELQALSSRNEAILASVPDIIMEVDDNKVYTFANRAGIEFFGEDAIGREADYYFEGEQETYQLVAPLFEGSRDVVYVESWQRRRDGEKRLLAWWCRVLQDPEGDVTGALSTAHDITERKRAEEAVLASEARFSAAFRAGTIPMAITRADDGTLVETDQAFAELTGYSPEECIGKTTLELGLYVDPKEHTSIARELARAGRASNPDFRLGTKDGSVRRVSFSAARILLEGEPHWLSLMVDVTEQRVTANALLQSIARFRSFMANFPGLAYVKGGDGRVVFASEGFSRYLGMDPADMSGKTDQELFPADFAQKVSLDDRRVLESGRSETIEETFAGRAWATRKFPIPLPGEPPMLGGLSVDITDQKRAEEALRESEAHLRRAQEAAHLGSWDWDVRTGDLYWAEENYRIFGIPRGTTASVDTLLAYVHPEDRDMVQTAIEKTLSGGGPYDVRMRIIRGDGVERVVDAKADVSFDEEGAPAKMTGTVQDVTERARAEERVRHYAADLEQKVEERTAELARSNSDLERFAYVASHDLQEPLRMVSSFLQLLVRRYGDRLDAEADEFIGFAVDGATRMQRMIVDLLAFSRVRTQARELKPIAVRDVLDRVLENLRKAIDDSGADISCGRLPRVMADEMQLAQLFQNLIENAMKFCAEQTPRVQVSAKKQGGEWVFSVKDNGIGVDPAYFDQIFVVFKRLHTNEYEGTGIGLAICEKIVERHGGRIWVESGPGQGSTFRFTMPAIRTATTGNR